MVIAAMKLKDTPWKESYDQPAAAAAKLLQSCPTLCDSIYGNLDSILKTRDITLPTNVPLVKAMVFPVVMYARESWTIKKAEY